MLYTYRTYMHRHTMLMRCLAGVHRCFRKRIKATPMVLSTNKDMCGSDIQCRSIVHRSIGTDDNDALRAVHKSPQTATLIFILNRSIKPMVAACTCKHCTVLYQHASTHRYSGYESVHPAAVRSQASLFDLKLFVLRFTLRLPWRC